MLYRSATIGLMVVMTVAGGAWGQVGTKARQTTSPRIAPAQSKVYSGRQDYQDNQALRLRTRIPVNIDGATARSAIRYVADLAGLNLVVSWKSLELLGIDPDTPVRLKFRSIPAQKALEVIFMQLTEEDLFLDVDPWLVRVMTREQANRKAVVKIYPVGDLLYDAPNFTKAPDFDLTSIATDDVGGTTIWNDTSTEEEPKLPKEEKGKNLADMICQTIEPDLWMRNGGTVASIRYHNGMLIVRAPEYVHARLGFSPSDRYKTSSRAAPAPPTAAPYSRSNYPTYRRSNGIAAVGMRSAPTAGIGR